MVEARCYVPVDVADIVTKLILTHLAESHTSAFKNTVVFSRKNLIGQSTCFDLYFSDLFEQFLCFHWFIGWLVKKCTPIQLFIPDERFVMGKGNILF